MLPCSLAHASPRVALSGVAVRTGAHSRGRKGSCPRCLCVCVCVCAPADPWSLIPIAFGGNLDGCPYQCQKMDEKRAGELLSLSAWLQISILSRYTKKRITRAVHSAVMCAFATSAHDHPRTIHYLYSVLPCLPMLYCYDLLFCASWLVKHAHWASPSRSPWSLPPNLSPDGTTGFWCSDGSVLLQQALTVRPSDQDCPHCGAVCVGAGGCT